MARTEDEAVAYELVAMLSAGRAEEYDDWIRLGMCLKAISAELLPLWDNFSKKSSKYRRGVCRLQWSKLRPSGISMGSLHHWAKEDSPAAYQAWKEARELAAATAALSFLRK
jgi:hypothetical protein